MIINEFYNKIFFSYFFYKILININLDEGARTQLFEKIVINYLTNINYSNYFNDVFIQKYEEMNKFLPNKNERQTNNIKKKYLEKVIYLFTQKKYKVIDFDCLIVFNNENEVKIICLQISIHKAIIYTIQQLQKFIISMIEYLTLYYEINIEKYNVYFSYIFDFLKINEQNTQRMLKDCNNKNIKYFFFDCDKEIFVNNEGKKIEKLFDYTTNIFSKTIIKGKRTHNELTKNEESMNYLTKKMKPSFTISETQLKRIISILINEFKSKNGLKIEFLGECFDFNTQNLIENHIFLSDLGDNKILLIYCDFNSNLKFISIDQSGKKSDYKSIPDKFQLYKIKFNK